MFRNFYHVVHRFLNEGQRNKILVDDVIIEHKTSLPPKSDLGRELKAAVREANVAAEWYFHFDRIEYIRLLRNKEVRTQIPLLTPNGKGDKQRQRKFNCFIRIDEDYPYNEHPLTIFNPMNLNDKVTSHQISKSGDLIILPTFVPYNISFNNYPMEDVPIANTVWLNAMIEGLSFR